MHSLAKKILLGMIFLSTFTTVSAEQRIIETTGEYQPESYEDLSVARRRALNDAIRLANVQANVYIKNISEAKDNILEMDTIRMISANVLRIQGEPRFEIIEDGESKTVICNLTTIIDDTNITESLARDYRENSEAVQQNRDYELENARLDSELADLKKKLTNVVDLAELRRLRAEVKANEEKFLANTHFLQGNKYYYEKNYPSALEEYNQAVELNPNLSAAYTNRGVIFYNLGEIEKSLADYNHAVELNPNDSATYVNLSSIYFDAGNIDQALNSLNEAIALDSQNAVAYYNRALIYQKLGENRLALSDYDRSLQIEPNNAEAYNARGILNDACGYKYFAVEDFSDAIALNPNFSSAYFNRGNVLGMSGKYNAAIRDYDRLLELVPNFADGYNFRGSAYEGLGKFDEAIQDYSHAIELNPDDYLSYVSRGKLLYDRGDKDRAREDFQTSLRLNPNLRAELEMQSEVDEIRHVLDIMNEFGL